MNKLIQFLQVCIQNTEKNVSEICKMVEKMKIDVDRLPLVLIMKKKFPTYFAKIELFSILKPKVVHLGPFLSFLTLLKFWKQNFMYFGRKHGETLNK